MHQVSENFEKILKKYNYPVSSEKELLEIVHNIEALAKLFYEFEKRSKKKNITKKL